MTNLSSVDGYLMPDAQTHDATLPEGCNTHFDLLRAAKRAGRRFGLGPQDLQLLELYLCFTRREDWAEGKRPLYTRSVTATAASLSISTRSVNTAERRLERLGLIRRDTRADGARGGWGGQGALYGIDLTPLIAAQDALLACAEAARAEADHIADLRAAISRRLGEARRIIAALGDRMAEAAALIPCLPTRTPQGRNPATLEAILLGIEPVIEALRGLVEPVDNRSNLHSSSDAPEESCEPIYNTDITSKVSCNGNIPVTALTRLAEKKKSADGESMHGLQNLKDRDISNAMPDTWHDLAGTLPGQFLWHRFTMAAQARLSALGVSEAAWHEAASVMGREAAALSLMILDANRYRPDKPVHNVAGALRAMTRRAERDALRLHASVYGLLARGRAAA